MAVLSLWLPVEVKIKTSPEARSWVRRALDGSLPPTELPQGERTKFVINIPTVLTGELQAAKHRFGHTGSMPAFISELIWAAWKGEHAPPEPGAPYRAESRKKSTTTQGNMFADRLEQQLFYEELAAGLAKNRIVVAEGATGLGKGRVIATLAKQYAEEQVLVAAPTLQVLGQLLEEYRGTHGDAAKARFLFGRDQFISETRLQHWIETAEEGEAEAVAVVKEWLEQGAGQVAGARTQTFRDQMPELAFLAEDLAALAPTSPIYELKLQSSDTLEEDRGHQAYSRLREQALEADGTVLFATHAGLIYDMMMRRRGQGGLLSESATALIDEAHLLAGIAESAHGVTVAFRTLEHALHSPSWSIYRLKTKARAALPRVREVKEGLMRFAKQHQDALQDGALSHEAQQRLRLLMHDLQSALRPLEKAPRDPDTSAVLDALQMAKDLMRGEVRVSISYSPVYNYPTIQTGPRSLQKFFAEFWEGFRRVALISATLYLPRRAGNPTCGLIRTSFHLPRERTHTFPPVRPDWVVDSVTLHTPTTPAEFVPPMEGRAADTQEFHVLSKAWHDNVAEAIRDAAKSASGGMLVLLTSYDSCSALAERLSDLGDRLIVQERGGFRTALAAYLASSKRGIKPVWLALGPAWTGLDLSDSAVAPEQDTLLTDVIIPRIPFGTERSRTHQARMQWMRTAERERTAFQFKQGVGRLVRRPGVKNRRLWVLDGRVWVPDYAWLTQPVNDLLAEYHLASSPKTPVKQTRVRQAEKA